MGERLEAVGRRRVVEFDYRGDHRRLEPFGVVHRFGHWYVVGRDQDKDALRAFRIDRFDGAARVGPDGAFEPPAGFDPATGLRADPMTYGHDPPAQAPRLAAPAPAPSPAPPPGS